MVEEMQKVNKNLTSSLPVFMERLRNKEHWILAKFSKLLEEMPNMQIEHSFFILLLNVKKNRQNPEQNKTIGRMTIL